MPPFKSLSTEWTVLDLMDDYLSTFNNSINITGQFVEAYYNVKRVLGYSHCLKRIVPYSSDKPFAYSIEHHHDALITFSVCEKLKPHWQRSIPSDTANVHCWSDEAQFSAVLRIGGSSLLVHERDLRIFDQGGPLKSCISI